MKSISPMHTSTYAHPDTTAIISLTMRLAAADDGSTWWEQHSVEKAFSNLASMEFPAVIGQ